jgi:hypothetical protein
MPLGELALSRGTVGRITEKRADRAWLDAAWADPRTRVLVVSGGRALMRLDDERAELVFVPPQAASSQAGSARFSVIRSTVPRDSASSPSGVTRDPRRLAQ